MPILTCYVSLKIESSPEMLHELIKYIQILDKDIYKTWNSDANQKNKFMQWVQNETEETDGDEESQIDISDGEQSNDLINQSQDILIINLDDIPTSIIE